MSCLILPTINFSNSHKSTSIKESHKSKKKVHEPKKIKTIVKELSKSSDESENSVDINDIDTIIYEDGFPSTESSNESDTNENNEDNTDNEQILNNPPVYDGIEPYYLFKRRWDSYMNNKLNHTLRKNILEFINSLFDTEYTNLISIKRIDEKDIPASRYIVDLIKEDPNYRKLFKIRCSTNISSPKMINSLLNKIEFSFVKMETNNGNYYCVKAGIINTSTY